MTSLHAVGLGILAATVALSTATSGVSRGIPHAPSVADTTVSTTDPAARCVTRRGAWVAIPFKPIDLGAQVAQVKSEERVIWGPRTRAVVNDSAQWVDVWHTATDIANSPERDHANLATDTVRVPAIHFKNDVVVFATTKGVGSGPANLAISSIRRCRKSGVIVVTTLQRGSRAHHDYPSRAFVAVRVPKQVLGGARVVFVDRYADAPGESDFFRVRDPSHR